MLRLVILFYLTLLNSLYATERFQDSTPYVTQVYGDIRLIGNTTLKLNTDKNDNSNTYFTSDDDVSNGQGVSAGKVQKIWANGLQDVSQYEANNFAYMNYIDIDEDENTFNSSSSTLSLPANSEIVYARLYWSGMIHNNADGTSINSLKDSSKKVKLKINSNNYSDIQVNTSNYDETEGWSEFFTTTNDTISGDTLNYSRYSAYKDVTDEFNGFTFDGSTITLTVANITSMEGWMRNYGNYAAWSLAIVYRNSSETYKHISLYTGYEEVYSNTIQIDIDGFLTPKSLEVFSNISVFSVEGEKTTLFGEDYLKVDGQDVTENSTYPNAKTNIFDSTITNTETRNPDINNTMGIDIDTFEIGADGNTNHPQIIQNSQTSTTIELSSGGDAYTVNAIALSTELYTPTFCYDYTYAQENNFFTEPNDGTKDPSLIGQVSTSSPIEMTIFLRNLVDSDVSISDMNISVLDINTSQATYIDPSTQLALIGDLTPQDISPSSSSDTSIIDIAIGNLNSNDFFYFYYKLDPKVTNIDMPITFTAKYNLLSGGTSIPYTLQIAKEIPMCNGDSFDYTPTNGIFNLVHKNYYNDNTQYYNLPTQVIKRDGSYKVIALDPDNTDTLKAQSTIVAIEAIDAGSFHNTDAACFEQYNYITKREWVIFDNEDSVDFLVPNDFFEEVRENAAFRVSLNLTNEENASLVKLEKISTDSYKISNYTELLNTITTCSQTVNSNGTQTNDPDTACGNDAAISSAQLSQCMECIYGYNTKYICSRDNFSIRPEAFAIEFNDQNQTTGGSIQRVVDNISDTQTPSGEVLHLSADYNYNLETTATTYTDSDPAIGYTKTFNLNTNDTFFYKWEPRSAINEANCNDIEDKGTSDNLRFINGVIDTNSSIIQVGEYRLTLKDTTWTTVDNNPEYMDHHIGTYFLDANTPDCILNSSEVNQPASTNALPLIGCEISSSHTNPNTNMIYKDYNITTHPYTFDISNITQSIGLDFNPNITNDSFIYVSNVTDDTNMSYHINGTIKTVGYNRKELTNFVDGCFAQPVSIDIQTSDTSLLDSSGNSVPYQYKYLDMDSSGATLASIDGNSTTNTTSKINLPASYFKKINNGALFTKLNLNYKRDISKATNPKKISFIDYNLSCTTTQNCNFYANNLSNAKTDAHKDLNSSISIAHYYERTNAMRQRFSTATANAFIYYETYCFGTGCTKSLLPDGADSNSTDDPRWFINTMHIVTSGNVGRVSQKNASNITADTQTGTSIVNVTLTYDSTTKGYPYKATMENNASTWLIYNKYDAGANTNEFEVEFTNGDSGWAGKHETNTTTRRNASDKTNRRSMW